MINVTVFFLLFRLFHIRREKTNSGVTSFSYQSKTKLMISLLIRNIDKLRENLKYGSLAATGC